MIDGFWNAETAGMQMELCISEFIYDSLEMI